MLVPITNYVFLPAHSQVVFTMGPGSPPLNPNGLTLIVNVTAGVIIYNPLSNVIGTSGSFSGPVLTLAYNTSSMSQSDSLVFVYDDGTALPPVHTVDQTRLLLSEILTEIQALRQGLVIADIIQEV